MQLDYLFSSLASSYFPGKGIIIIIGMMPVISIQKRLYLETVDTAGLTKNNNSSSKYQPAITTKSEYGKRWSI